MLKYNKVFLSDSTLLSHLLQTFNCLCHIPWKRQGYYILNHNKWVVQINKYSPDYKPLVYIKISHISCSN